MAGTYNGTYSSGIILSNPNSTITSAGVVKNTNGNAVYGAKASVFTLTNYGSVSSLGTSGNGVLLGNGVVTNDGTVSSTGGNGIYLSLGGSVTNGSPSATAATISANNATSTLVNGVEIAGAAGTAVNYGTITASGTGGNAIYLAAGGSATNELTGTLTGGSHGILVAGSAGTVVNLGSINDTGSINGAVALNAGGSFTNGAGANSTATVSANRTALSFKNVAATVTNWGTVIANATGTGGGGVYISGGGTFTNEAGALVKSTRNGVSSALTAATVINAGTIENTGTPASGGVGVYIGAGGALTNASTGVITSVSSVAVSAKNVAATVVNDGLIENTSTAIAAYFGAGGMLTNAGTIESAKAAAVLFKNMATVANTASLVNSGTILALGTSGTGVYSAIGGTLTNQTGGTITGYINAAGFKTAAGTIFNYGTLSATSTSHADIYFQTGGSLVNGSTSATSALISGAGSAINAKSGAATVTNFGTIIANTAQTGIYFGAGGTLTNNAGAVISGSVTTRHTAVTISNSGSIGDSGLIVAIYIGAGGSLTNASGAHITNTVGDAILIGGTAPSTAATTLINSGTISGASSAISVGTNDTGPTTIINYGVISTSGFAAINLGGGAETLVIGQGSTMTGAVSNFTAADTLDFAKTAGTSAALVDQSLDLFNNGTVVGSVALSGVFGSDQFVVSSDGNGGTNVNLTAYPPYPNQGTGDGLSDALMVNASGVVVLDEVGAGGMTYQQISQVGPEWQVVGEGPILGDGRDQVLLWAGSSAAPDYGAVVTGEVDNGKASYTQVASIGPQWNFEGVGSYGGGSSGQFLLWGNSSGPDFGALVVGTVIGSNNTSFAQIGAVGSEWQFEGTGQFLGNGSTDFLMWDTSSASSQYGEVVVGQDVGGTAQYTAVGGLDPTAWAFEGSGDLLGDGKDSVLLWNQNSGVLIAGELNSSNQLTYTQLGGVGPNWEFLGVGDYDGKSPSEFLMWDASGSNPSGTLEIGTVSGSSGNFTIAYTAVGGVGPSDWTFQPTKAALMS